MRDFILTGVVGLFVSLFLIRLLRPLALRIGFVDRPNARKHHEQEVPLIGGVTIFIAFCFAMLLLHVSLMPYRSLLAGSAWLILMGIVDDFKDLSARLRLFGQIMVSILLTAWGGLILNHVGNLFGFYEVHLGLWAMPLTMLLVVAYINAFNMIDGQDGLAGCMALGQTFWLLLFALVLQQDAMAHILVILMVLLLVFLNFNMHLPWRIRPSIFLGDSGSTFLGFVIAWITVMLSQVNPSVVKPVALLWVCALPLFDLVHVVGVRILERRSVFLPDRDHVHHVLQALGMKKSLSTGLLAGCQFILAGIGYLLNYLQVTESVSFFSFIGVFLSYLALLTWLRLPNEKKKVRASPMDYSH